MILFFLSQSDKNSGCYDNLQFPLTYNRKKWKLAIFAVSLQIFRFFFTIMFLELSSAIQMNFVQIAEFDWLPWQHKG